MKNTDTIKILENIAKEYNSPTEQRVFDKAIAALKYCDEHKLTYYVENKCFGTMEEE